jgi:hypothetical protein
MTLLKALNWIDNEFPIFAYDATDGRYLDETLGEFPFDEEGIKQRWDWYDDLRKRVLEGLRNEFLELRPHAYSTVCDLRMYRLREKIERTQREHACYGQMMDIGHSFYLTTQIEN